MEDRGKSWATGEDPTAESLALFFAHYSKGMDGSSSSAGGPHSHGRWWDTQRGGGFFPPNSTAFNAAISGATSGDLQVQLDYLLSLLSQRQLERLKNSEWKVC